MSIKNVLFASRHEPAVVPDNYTVTVQETVKIHGTEHKFSAEHKLTIAGDRFQIAPNHIRIVFPPRESLGDHWNCLAHVVFHRTTLPWERVGNSNIDAKGADRLPWLAVLNFDEDDPVPQVKTTTIRELHKLAGDCAGDDSHAPRYFLPQPAVTEYGHDPEAKASVIDVPAAKLRQICPSAHELKLLSHVRRWDGDLPGELSVVVGTRLPRPNKATTAHLVSVEGRYENDQLRDIDGEHPIRLVSLLSWNFTCRDEKQSFSGLLEHLDMTPDRPRLPEAAIPAGLEQPVVQKFRQGYVPLPHRLHSGKNTGSWYHGPLSPIEEKAAPPLPLTKHASELTRLDAATQMLDVSLASAWEIGRMATLKRRSVAREFFHWKRTHLRASRDAASRLKHLPYRALTGAPDLPHGVENWFAELAMLKHVPFDYLVPDPAMLPPESMRIFTLDPTWIEAMLMGAFSVGRLSQNDAAMEHTLRTTSTTQTPTIRTGILLRSDAVSGWPDLEAHGYRSNQTHTDAAAEDERLPVVRHERLSDHVLIAIFDGVVKTVDIGQKPEALHFGFNTSPDDPENTAGFFKQRRDVQGVEQSGLAARKTLQTVAHAPHRIDVRAMARAMGVAGAKSSDFALQMIVGVERVRFNMG